jgi:hypothetical protein
MWRRVSCAKLLLWAAILGLLATGCSGPLAPYPLGKRVEDPAPKDVIAFIALFQPFAANWSIATGEDYVWAGYAYVDHQCNNFFTALEMARRDLSFSKDMSTSAFSAASGILPLVIESQKQISIVAALGTFVAAAINNYSNSYLYGQIMSTAQHAPLLWNHVVDSQNNYKFVASMPILLEIRTASLANVAVAAKAHNLVQNYARICSLHQLELFVQTALTSGAAVASNQKSGAPLSMNFIRGEGPPPKPRGSMPAYIIR